MNDAIAPLPAWARMTDADYPGVVAYLSQEWRLVVSWNGKRYALQQLGQTDAGPLWVPAGGGRTPGTLAGIVAKFGGRVPGLAAVCESLPDQPAQAAPLFVARSDARQAAFEARDVRRAAYARVVSRDGQMRLSVDPDGLLYLLQWVPKDEQDWHGASWVLLASSPTLAGLWAFVAEKVFEPVGPGPLNRRRGDDLADRWAALCDGLPERADAGVWPFVPPVP